MSTAETLPKAVRNAAKYRGHTFIYDEPECISSMRRWTCTVRECHRAVIVRPNGSAYGTATSESCGPW